MSNHATTVDSFIELPNATLLRRLAALVYDLFILFALTVAYFAVVTIVRVAVTGSADRDLPATITVQLPIIAGYWATLGSYYVICWRKQGQTLGMKAWRLRTQQTGHHLVTLKQAWLRVVLAPLSMAVLGLGYWMALLPARQCWHDHATATEVVVLPKSKES